MDESSCTDRAECSITFLGRGWYAEEIIITLQKKKKYEDALGCITYKAKKQRKN